MDPVAGRSLKESLEEIHRITRDLGTPLKPRFVALILYANTFDKVGCGDARKLSLVCINLACKMEETYCRFERILEHFCRCFRDFSMKKEDAARTEIEVFKAIRFQPEIHPIHFTYFRILKACGVRKLGPHVLELIESVHLDARILQLGYLRDGPFCPGDVALSLVGDSHLRRLCDTLGLFVNFHALRVIRNKLFAY